MVERRPGRIGQAVEIGLAAGGEIDPFDLAGTGPAEQRRERLGMIEKAVAIGAEHLPVDRHRAIRALAAGVGQLHRRPCQAAATGHPEMDFVAAHGRLRRCPG